METILILDPRKNKMVTAGKFSNKTFYKTVKPSHYMRAQQGYGIQEEAIEILKKKGCEKVQISTKQETRESNFNFWTFMSRDYGHGPQYFFAWDRMTVIKSPQKELF